MPILSVASFLAASELTHEEVPIAELEDSVLIWEINSRERIIIEKAADATPGAEFIDLVVAYTVRDLEGNRLFDQDSLDKLRDANPDALLAIAKHALRINKMTPEGVDKAEGES
jgi:hypothetical protein